MLSWWLKPIETAVSQHLSAWYSACSEIKHIYYKQHGTDTIYSLVSCIVLRVLLVLNKLILIAIDQLSINSIVPTQTMTQLWVSTSSNNIPAQWFNMLTDTHLYWWYWQVLGIPLCQNRLWNNIKSGLPELISQHNASTYSWTCQYWGHCEGILRRNQNRSWRPSCARNILWSASPKEAVKLYKTQENALTGSWTLSTLQEVFSTYNNLILWLLTPHRKFSLAQETEPRVMQPLTDTFCHALRHALC